MEIAIDFDGTVVAHDYPEIGHDIGAKDVLRDLVANGHKLILNTMRSGKELSDAVNWFLVNEIHLYGVQFNPEQAKWTASNKCYAQLYIDDAALGCPLHYPAVGVPENGKKQFPRPYVDWELVRIELESRGLIKKQ